MNALDMLTITIMAVGSLIVWRLKPTAAMAVYLACILLYPEAWSIKLGPLPTLFVGKVLIFPLLLNLVVKARRLETFKINVLDAAVFFLLVGRFIATLTHDSLSQAVADQSHVVATQTLTYFAARLAVNSRRELFSFVKSLAWAAVPLLLILVSDTWLVWCFFAFFLGWQIAFCTVSSIYQMSILLYLLIGLMGSLPNLVEVEDETHDIVLEAEGAA